MNKFENWFCGSCIWRFVTERKLLPWILSGYALGDHVLEVGAGPGATTVIRIRSSLVCAFAAIWSRSPVLA